MISVIVPFYNVEEELPRCIESLKRVKCPSQEIEFLLIDDGSTDGSGRIADLIYDPRFRVFHTDNKGVSAARNLGIEEARGEWLMFADSDDWVEPDYCAVPFEAAVKNQADLVIFDYRSWKNGQPVSRQLRRRLKKQIRKMLGRENEFTLPSGIVSQETAVEFGEPAPWNKFCSRKLFNTIRYPEGQVFEDVVVTHKIIYEAQRIVMIPDILYNYRVRPGSIGHTWSEKFKRDCFLSARERYNDLNSHHYPQEKHEAVLWNCAITFLMSTEADDETVRQAEQVLDSIPGIPKKMPRKNRFMLAVWKKDPKLFHQICRILGLKKP